MAGSEAMSDAATLYGIGVGPGDIELLTLKAARLLNEVKVIAYPATIGEESLARSIVAPLIPQGVIELPIKLPMEKRREPAQAAYDAGAAALAQHLEQGRDVLFLCEGDPFFYGSFMYLHERIATSYPCIVVPGVTSITACAAARGRPLAARVDRLKVVPATLAEERLQAELQSADAAAVIKVGSHFDKVRRVVDRLGLSARAAIVEAVTQSDERVLPLADIESGSRPYFSTVLIYRGSEPW